MSSQRADIETEVAASDNRVRPDLGFALHCACRLAPLALDNARNKIDPMMYSVTVGGLSQNQIEGLDLRAMFGLERIRAAFRALAPLWR
jgi:hypothetical protein